MRGSFFLKISQHLATLDKSKAVEHTPVTLMNVLVRSGGSMGNPSHLARIVRISLGALLILPFSLAAFGQNAETSQAETGDKTIAVTKLIKRIRKWSNRAMKVLLLLTAATVFAGDLSMPPAKEESRLAMKKKQDDMASEALRASETPEFTNMGKLLSSHHEVQSCGVCSVRVDPRGIYCRVQVRQEDNCRDNCGAEVLLISSKALEKKGFVVSGTAPDASDDGYVTSGGIRLNRTALLWAVEKAQKLRGLDRRKFLADPIATCRK